MVRDVKMSKNPNWKGGKIKNIKGYILIRMPKHPCAVQGYVREDILLMEKRIKNLK